MTDDLTVHRVEAGDDRLVFEAAHLFDGPPHREWVARFLSEAGHHLLIARIGGRPAGFLSAVEMTHPDKGTEMFLYELSVDAAHRRRGVASTLLAELRDLARQHGCYELWVLTDRDNRAALGAYRKSGADAESDHVMLTWRRLDA